jgi:hypothetical protein
VSDEMVAGRELDALVAEKVMGWEVERGYPCWCSPEDGSWDAYEPPERDEDWDDARWQRAQTRYAERIAGEFCHSQPVRVERFKWEDTGGDGLRRTPLAFYSTDISAAWEVVEKLTASGHLTGGVSKHLNGKYMAVFSEQLGGGVFAVSADCESAPLAICLAALKAVA